LLKEFQLIFLPEGSKRSQNKKPNQKK